MRAGEVLGCKNNPLDTIADRFHHIAGARHHHQHSSDMQRAKSTNRPKKTNESRSEEHTSELQSLMRSSYAVHCLKKKTHDNSYLKERHKPQAPQHSENMTHT